jgi:hypothetical protein
VFFFLEFSKLCIFEINGTGYMFSFPNIFRVITSRIMGWAGQVACAGRREMWRNLNERDHLEDTGVEGTILKWN